MSLRDLARNETVERSAHRASLPPLPVIGEIEPPAYTDSYNETSAGLFEGMKAAGRGLLKFASFSADILGKPQQWLFKKTLIATGNWDQVQYQKRLQRGLEGKERISGREWLDAIVGQSYRSEVSQAKLPDWVGKMFGKDEGPELGSVLGFGAEMLVDPLLAFGFLPRSAYAAVKLGRAYDLADTVTFGPLRWMGRNVWKHSPFSALINQVRDPRRVLPGEIVDALEVNEKDLKLIADGLQKEFKRLKRDHNFKNGFLGKNTGNIDEARVWDHLWVKQKSLNIDEAAFVNDITENVLMPLRNELLAGRHIRMKDWDVEKNLLRQFNPQIKGQKMRPLSIGRRELEDQVNIHLPRRPSTPEKMKKMTNILNNTPKEQKDVMHSLAGFLRTGKERVVYHNKENGVLGKYGIWDEFGKKKQNPVLKELIGDDANMFQYWRDKVFQITNSNVGRRTLALHNVWLKAWDTLVEENVSKARQNRIGRVLVDNDFATWALRTGRNLTEPQKITSLIVGNQVTALLGGNLSSAIKNTSQLLTTTAEAGVPAVMRGIFKMFDVLTPGGRKLRSFRKETIIDNATRQLVDDDVFIQHFGSRFTHLMMKPFEAVENFVRGVSYNVSMAHQMGKKGIEEFSDEALVKMSNKALNFSNSTNYTYGLAGRSELMASPIARMAFSLQSYSWKTTEKVAEMLNTDGGMFTRMVALHGWAIRALHDGMGINAENWLGWGFLPPSPLGKGPAFSILKDLTDAMSAMGNDDEVAYSRAIARVRGDLREVAKLFGGEGEEAGWAQTVAAATSKFGLTPLPMLAVGKVSRAVNEFMTGTSESAGGNQFTYISKADAIKSVFFQTQARHEELKFQKMVSSGQRQVEKELRKRIRNYVGALQGSSGDDVLVAAQALSAPINIRVPLTAERTRLGVGALTVPGPVELLESQQFLTDNKTFYPTPDMIDRRIENEVARRGTPEAIREMFSEGWLQEVYWAEYTNRYLRTLESRR